MTTEHTSFQAGIDFPSVLRIISKQVYETPLAFIRENVQNAVDAIRMQAYREHIPPEDERYKIEITVQDKKIIVQDNGIGMSEIDLQSFFWKIGASGKRTQEALSAGCVGTFGIGGFANFGVCEKLEVISQTQDCESGTLTRLSEAAIDAAGSSIPSVTKEPSKIAGPRGTVVIGYLREPANIDDLRRYLQDFVRFVPMVVSFNGQKVSREQFADATDRENYKEIGDGQLKWDEGDLAITGFLFEDRGHTLVATLESMSIGGEVVDLKGQLRFENGPIDVFKYGFKLCATQVGSTIGVSGRLDCDRFAPTAGRDSLDSESTSLLGRIVSMLEKVAIETVLEAPERIGQHTRVFRYVLRHGLVNKIGNVTVRLADGAESTLEDIRRKSKEGGVGVFFGMAQKQALNQIMHARGHLVVLLSSDRYRRDAESLYLERYCGAKPFDGMIECVEHYEELSRFEKVFLSELELNISRSYEITQFRLIPGKLTEDIPVFLKEHSGAQPLDIYVDVRHPEVVKLETLGFTSMLYSLVATFCQEYLGPSLKKWSPIFFGNGALNLELLAKRRSELWILVKDDIGEVTKGGQRHVVTRSDVEVVNVQGDREQPEHAPRNPNPRILHIVNYDSTTPLAGYYIRVPDKAYSAYGDLLPPCENRGLVWAGNKITYIVSDAVSAAFQYEIRLDELVATEVNGNRRAEGAIELDRPLQEMFAGIYFPIPTLLESFLVPTGDQEIRLYLHCEWIDMRTAKHWLPREIDS